MEAQLLSKTKSFEELEREVRMSHANASKRMEQTMEKLSVIGWAALTAFAVSFATAYGSSKGKQFAQPDK